MKKFVVLLSPMAAFVSSIQHHSHVIAGRPKLALTRLSTKLFVSSVSPGSSPSSSSSSSSSSSIPPFGRNELTKASSNSYLRWNTTTSTTNKNANNDANNAKYGNSRWEMQTAVTTFERPSDGTKVDLHAQLHFGSCDYFDYYNSNCQDKYDSILYELLIDDSLLEYDSTTNHWKLSKPIMASLNDKQVAQNYQWSCQVDSIDYTQPNFVHADFTRQEFLRVIDNTQNNNNKNSNNVNTPLWKLSSKNSNNSPVSTAAEAFSALFVGPPTVTVNTNSESIRRRLFTNLFLPGDSFANNLRALLWMTIPAPELSIILLDWASLFQSSTSKQKSSSSSSSSQSVMFNGGLSPIAIPILTNFFQGQLSNVRKYLFGQVLLTSSSSSSSSSNNISNNSDASESFDLLITKRNDRALQVFNQTLQQLGTKSSSRQRKQPYSIALLYGSSHCPDLHNKLVQDFGFVPTKTTWRTAWAIEQQEQPLNTSFALLLATTIVIYLGVGALDWVNFLADVTTQISQEHDYLEASVLTGFYLIRHVLLYLGLSKFLVDWNNP